MQTEAEQAESAAILPTNEPMLMNVLDPFEVAHIEMWPLDAEINRLGKKENKTFLDRAEYTVFQKVLPNEAQRTSRNTHQPAQASN